MSDNMTAPLAQRENCTVPNKKLFGPMVCHMINCNISNRDVVTYKRPIDIPLTIQQLMFTIILALITLKFPLHTTCIYI